MSGCSVVNYLASNAVAVTALVPAARIITGVAALSGSDGLPAVSIRSIDAPERLTVDMAASRRLITERVQVTAYAGTYDEKLPILMAIRDACVRQHGAINGVIVDGILPGGTGPDLDEPGDPIFEQSMDLIVKWFHG